MKSSLAVTDIEKQNPRTVRMTVAKKDLRTLTEKAENLGFTVAAERYRALRQCSKVWFRASRL